MKIEEIKELIQALEDSSLTSLEISQSLGFPTTPKRSECTFLTALNTVTSVFKRSAIFSSDPCNISAGMPF